MAHLKLVPPSRDEAVSLDALTVRLFETRRLSLELAGPLTPEDMVVQASEEASPTKWHLAHVTWFFETFILMKYLAGYRAFDDTFNYCFNSYYESQGQRQPRAHRGLLTRPTSERVLAYRAHVDEALEKLLSRRGAFDGEIARLIEVGINHEQQHQELLLTDILALFAASPLRPAYRARRARFRARHARSPPAGSRFAGGIRKIGNDGAGFAWDNEAPRHDASSSRLPSRRSRRHQRRMARLHRRWRLPHGLAVACRRLDDRQSRRLARAPLLGGARRRPGWR